MRELDFWREEPTKRAKTIADEIEQVARRARASGLAVTAYILDLAANEARKDAEKVRGNQPGLVKRSPSSVK